jgi:putative ABC transport system substrate-binding protein
MKKILFLTLIVAALGGEPVAEAQQAKKVPRIGFLAPGSPDSELAKDAFQQGLRELGYIVGHNITIEYRWGEGKPDRLAELASELRQLRVDLFLVVGTLATQVAKKTTTTIPIVMAYSGDPVRAGFVTSLAHPGGNITGLSSLAPELSGKRVELLKEAVPKASRLAVLWHSRNPVMQLRFSEIEVVGQALGLQIQSLALQVPDDIGKVFEAATAKRPDALFIIANAFTLSHQSHIIGFASQNRLPAMYEQKEFVEAGGLMSYAPDHADLFRRTATYVHKILKGAKPGDLPVEQPMKFELVINLKAAKQIGLTIPPNVLVRADKVIK